MAASTDYTSLITSEHSSKPKFAAMFAAVAQCFVDQINVMQSIPAAFDLDQAIGVQLDAVGLWAGITRQVKTPLNVYFSLDTVNLGFDQGNWQGPFDPSTGLVSLDDSTFRTLIRAKIAANSWDGTIPGAASAYANLFGSPSTSSSPTPVTAQQFAIGDGSTSSFQLTIGGQPLFSVSSAQIYRNDWQGNQLLYPTARTNSFLRSNAPYGTGWSNGGTVSGTTGVSAPDGSNNAVTLSSGASSNAYTYQTVTFVTGTAYRVSVFANPVTAGAQFKIRNFTQAGDATFTLSGSGSVAGSTGIASSATIVALSGGWYLCSVVFTANASGSVNISPGNFLAASTNITFFGAQIGVDPGAPTSYIPTTTAAVTVTDYVMSSTGLVALASAPVAGSILTWTGTGTPVPAGSFIFLQDNQDMTMTVGVSGSVPSALLRSLLSGGYLHLKPEGVHANYVVPSANNTPLFGFDVENVWVSGFDVGSMAIAA